MLVILLVKTRAFLPASISRGITDRDAATGKELLADINPTFNWVRLAQRVPVRIRFDDLSKEHQLIAGTTCTVIVKPKKK